MTTKVKITASGPCYPARVKVFSPAGDLVTELVVSDGFSWELGFLKATKWKS